MQETWIKMLDGRKREMFSSKHKESDKIRGFLQKKKNEQFGQEMRNLERNMKKKS